MMDGGQKPSVGRIVHYFSYGTPNGEYKSEARAAVITAVKEDQSTPESELVYKVDLCVMNPTGLFFNQNVKQGSEPGQWNWPARV